MDPITATYAQDDADWTITVAGLGKEFSARAPGIIAARDRADQMVEKVTTKRAGRTVVHLLNGSAFDFTAAYMQARLTRTATPDAQPEPAPAPAQGKAEDAKAGKPAAGAKKARASEASPKDARPQRARSAAPRKPRQATAKGSSGKGKAAARAKKRAEIDGALSGDEAMPAAAKSGSA